METLQKQCRLCLSQTDFYVSLFGTYCQKTNMIKKILVCLKLVIEDNDYLDTICYKCSYNVEKYHEFMMDIKNCQTRYYSENLRNPQTHKVVFSLCQTNKKLSHVTSYIKEQVYDADLTFSFLEVTTEGKEIHKDGRKMKETKVSRQFLSYNSPPYGVTKLSSEPLWKIPKPRLNNKNVREKIKSYKAEKTPCCHSNDLLDPQNVDNSEPKTTEWQLTSGNDNVIKRIREKLFGQCDF